VRSSRSLARHKERPKKPPYRTLDEQVERRVSARRCLRYRTSNPVQLQDPGSDPPLVARQNLTPPLQKAI
jgi:hypothetical protein